MKNREIIADAAVKAGILTQEEAKGMLDEGKYIPLHTIGGWRLRGEYKIKDGETGIEVKLWKRKEDGTGFYLAKANLFREEQLYIE